MKNLLLNGIVLILFLSCGNKEDVEKKGSECLSKARTAFSASNFAKARSFVEELREKHPLALNAREEGILLMDSINLFEAKIKVDRSLNILMDNSLPENLRDSTLFDKEEAEQRMRFYTKKLEHDKQMAKKH